MTMDMIAVDYQQGALPAASEASVAQTFERRSGVVPPPGYAAFAARHGGTRFPSDRRYVLNPETGEHVGIGTVYHYDPKVALYSVQDIWAQTASQLPAELVPFASSEFGGEICFDYRAGKAADPAVVLFDYEAAPGREITRLAASFDKFINAVGTLP